MIYAGFWKRFFAALIDVFILTMTNTFFNLSFIYIFEILKNPTPKETAETLSQMLGFILIWLYFSYMESSSEQATLGKQALKIKVTDLIGNRINLCHAMIRHFNKLIPLWATMIFSLIGYFRIIPEPLSLLLVSLIFLLIIGYPMTIFFTKKKQSIHDMISQTLVLNHR